MTRPVVVLILASGASWESSVLALLERDPRVVVLRRCVDVADLLAAASAGQADAAVVAGDAPGLDQAAADHLRRHHVRLLAVMPPGSPEQPAWRPAGPSLGAIVDHQLADDRLADLSAWLHSTTGTLDSDPSDVEGAGPVRNGPPGGPDNRSPRGRILAVWGPAGAPGRTTVAVSVAAELACRGRRTTLVDADPYGGAVAQHLGVLDEVSGLLSAARLAGSGLLEERFATVQRSIGEHLTVVTGLPRADRWQEIRGGSIEGLLDVAVALGDVVVDTGFCLEPDPSGDTGGRPHRNLATLAALECADEVIVVGSAEPTGLARLVGGLLDLAEALPGVRPVVVVNRVRASLGWSEREILAMLADTVDASGLHFLPLDHQAVDRALAAGRTLVDSGDSPLRRAVARVVDGVAPATRQTASRRGARPASRRGSRRRVLRRPTR